ncbi:activator of basal transcription 1-like [Anopheles cruzii]|uniref:activator of basal transcription 1-like n=1 Tax=Anopheles cruzii TaxID=68878 RepID=UPI0022EC4A88|nr:activator of basal transcription 1-like [Anopheles cruzii]
MDSDAAATSDEADSGQEVEIATDGEQDEPSKEDKPGRFVRPLEKKKKPGIVHISLIPKHMNVTILREMLEPYGKIGRIYLEASNKGGKVRKTTARGKRAMLRYTAGWVEFERKRVAKAIVAQLNAKPISTSRKSVFCDVLWCMKYMPRFKWIHLSELKAYEKAVSRQKLRTEIAQARKESSYFQNNLDRSEAARKRASKVGKSGGNGAV